MNNFGGGGTVDEVDEQPLINEGSHVEGNSINGSAIDETTTISASSSPPSHGISGSVSLDALSEDNDDNNNNINNGDQIDQQIQQPETVQMMVDIQPPQPPTVLQQEPTVENHQNGMNDTTSTTTTTTTTTQTFNNNQNGDEQQHQEGGEEEIQQQEEEETIEEKKNKLIYLSEIGQSQKEYNRVKSIVCKHMDSLKNEDLLLEELNNERIALLQEYRQHELALLDIQKDLQNIDTMIKDRRVEKQNVQKQIDQVQEQELDDIKNKVDCMRAKIGLSPLPTIEDERNRLQSSYLTKRLSDEMNKSTTNNITPPTKKRPGRPRKE